MKSFSKVYDLENFGIETIVCKFYLVYSKNLERLLVICYLIEQNVKKKIKLNLSLFMHKRNINKYLKLFSIFVYRCIVFFFIYINI